MPVDVVVDVNFIALQRDGLHELRVLPVAGYFDACSAVSSLTDSTESACASRPALHQRTRIDVPRVVILRRVLEKLELAAAAARSDGLELVAFSNR